MNPKGLLSNKWFFWPLFLLLFIYAIIRAWSVVPMLDELATFFSYIRTGHYFNSIEVLDANNHVVNSFLGHQFYRLFGDHFFLFRLSSLCAFPVYFFSVKSIVQKAIPDKPNVLVFLALVSVPWIFEYFSYSRGYGMAIAFFFAAIAFVIRWKESKKLIHFILIFASLYVAIISSLTYMMPGMLLIGIVGVLLLLREYRSKKALLFGIVVLLVWCVALIPFVRYSFELKEAGALWWGNQDGLWQSTGKSLSGLVLFSQASWTLYLISFFLLFGVVSFVLSWKQKGLWSYLKETEVIVFLLMIGSLIGIVAMRYLLDMNYPMDRVGMYLVPMFILYVGVFLAKYRYSKFGLALLCFFPLSFLYHVNVSTSIFSPEDRIPTYLSDQIKSRLTDQTALSAEYVSHMSYAYACRNDEKVHMAYTAEKTDEFKGDYHITWLGLDSFEDYELMARDPDSHTCFWKREKPFKRSLVLDTLVQNRSTQDMYFDLFKGEVDSALRGETIQFEIAGKMLFNEKSNDFNIFCSFSDQNGVQTSVRSPYFNWYFGDRTDVHFTFVDQPFKLKENEEQITVFLMNSDLRQIKVDFMRVRIYRILPEE